MNDMITAEQLKLGILAILLTAIAFLIVDKFVQEISVFKFLIIWIIFLFCVKLISYAKRRK